MIKRELYMSRIRPFIGTELVKVMTGIRRCGKSVMLELIKHELTESGVSPTQFVSINFEDTFIVSGYFCNSICDGNIRTTWGQFSRFQIFCIPCSKFIILVCDKTGFCVRSRYRFAHSINVRNICIGIQPS